MNVFFLFRTYIAWCVYLTHTVHAKRQKTMNEGKIMLVCARLAIKSLDFENNSCLDKISLSTWMMISITLKSPLTLLMFCLQREIRADARLPTLTHVFSAWETKSACLLWHSWRVLFLETVVQQERFLDSNLKTANAIELKNLQKDLYYARLIAIKG